MGYDSDAAAMCLMDAEQRRGLAYAPKIPAALSIIASLWVIWTITYTREKRQRLYQRLMLSLSVTCLISSLAYFFGTWAMPTDTECVETAYGNHQTCVAQGLLIHASVNASSVYYASLSLYSFVAILNDFKEARILWIEKWIHFTAIAVSPLITVFFLVKKLYNPTQFLCSVGLSKTQVQDINFSESTFNYLDLTFNCAPCALMLILSTIMTVALWFTEKQKKKLNHELCGKKKILEDARRMKSKAVAMRTLLYLIIFYASSICEFVSRHYRNGRRINYFAAIALLLLVPLQGFFIAVVYFLIQKRCKQNRSSSDTSYHQRCSIISQRRILADTGALLLDKSSCSNSPNPPSAPLDGQIVIFDGSNPSSKWAKFILDDEIEENSIAYDENKCVDLASIEHSLEGDCRLSISSSNA